jgi:hypothetical protein
MRHALFCLARILALCIAKKCQVDIYSSCGICQVQRSGVKRFVILDHHPFPEDSSFHKGGQYRRVQWQPLIKMLFHRLGNAHHEGLEEEVFIVVWKLRSTLQHLFHVLALLLIECCKLFLR